MSDRTEDLGTYEMLWDCPFCGTKKLLGVSQRHCPNCGGAQDPAKRYFPSDADKVAVKDHPFMGADLLCPYCKAPNSAKANNCIACGGELAGAKSAKLRSEQVVSDGEAFAAESAADAKKDFAAAMAAAGKGPKVPAPPKKKSALPLVLGIVGALVVLIVVLIFWRKPQSVVVDGHRWERQIAVERFGPQHLSEWCDHVPMDARFVSRHREVRSHKKVQDGETCQKRRVDNGNGSFSERRECTPKYRDEPIYDDKCDFTADRWAGVQPLTASGIGVTNPAPAWPAANLKTGTCIGCEREAGRSETYTVVFKREKDGKSLECTMPEPQWSGIKPGSKWKLDVAVLTGHPNCDSLKPL